MLYYLHARCTVRVLIKCSRHFANTNHVRLHIDVVDLHVFWKRSQFRVSDSAHVQCSGSFMMTSLQWFRFEAVFNDLIGQPESKKIMLVIWTYACTHMYMYIHVACTCAPLTRCLTVWPSLAIVRYDFTALSPRAPLKTLKHICLAHHKPPDGRIEVYERARTIQ